MIIAPVEGGIVLTGCSQGHLARWAEQRYDDYGVDNDGGDDDGVGGLDGGVENDGGDDDEDHCQPDCLNRGSPEDCSNV